MSAGGGESDGRYLFTTSDCPNCRIARPASVEATSLGAAELAGLYTGFWKEEDLDKAMHYDAEFTPKMPAEERERVYAAYKDAVKRCSGWMKDK